MTHAEQHTLIVELKDHMKKMKRYDQEEFEMFLKRDTDDEDLDTMSQKRLIRLYEQYIGPLEEGA
jgi:galactose-1-phosphate uridylyltransferase